MELLSPLASLVPSPALITVVTSGDFLGDPDQETACLFATWALVFDT